MFYHGTLPEISIDLSRDLCHAPKTPTHNPHLQPKIPQILQSSAVPPCLHYAQVNGALRLESFDAFMPPAVDFWRTVTDEHYDLLEKRSQQGDSAVFADSASRGGNC